MPTVGSLLSHFTCFKVVIRLLQGCYKVVLRMLQGCYKVVIRLLQSCSGVAIESYCVSRVFQGYCSVLKHLNVVA